MSYGRLFGLAWIGLSACGSKGASTTNSATASSAAASASAATADAPAMSGPWSVAVESKNPLVLGALDGGVAVIDTSGVHLAVASGSAKLEERAAPMGFASDVTRILRVQGRAPTSIWITAEGATAEGKKSPRTPFYRLEKNNKLKQIADDWSPLVVPWSKKRVLVMSTSSERLKVKVLEPYTKKPVDDQPSTHFPAPECAKSIQLLEAVSLPSGEVVGAGKCKLAGMKERAYVALRWAASAAASEAPGAAAPHASASAAAAAADASAAPDGSSAPSVKPDEADDTRGAPMTVLVVTSNRIQHRRIAVGPTGEVYFAASGEAAGDSSLFEIGADQATKVELPKLEGALVDVAFTASGDLFAITQESAWRKPAKGEWASVSPSGGVALSRLAAAGDAMYVVGGRSSAKDAPGELLRFGGSDPALQWQ